MNRIRVWYIAVSAVFLLTVFELPAQVAPRQFSDAENATAHTRLFRRTNLLIAKAKAAESPDEPTARLNTVLPRQLNLSDFDAKTLVRVAQEWQTAFTPLQAKRVHEVQYFERRDRTYR